MKHLCILLIRFYRRYLSPLKRNPCCRFTPTCSAYAIEAFEKRGFFVGLILTVWRVLRCNPYCVGGYDPVPEKGLRYRGPRVIPIPNDCCEDGSERPDEDVQNIASDREMNGEDTPNEISERKENHP
ncbi:MAG: membrane protein insertion efficiency factor YidD [Ruminococcaceae bacterium]|nr:membrane protein insertion efficiency factor YidD [Oscillospiraceae bacterium]